MTLLELFDRIRKEQQLHIVVLHFNHRLRPEADEEQAFVEKACLGKGLEFACDGADVAAFSRRAGMSIEMAAREKRYTFFEKSAVEFKLDKIATGHTASDRAETVLDHILRGAGLSGLAGIPVKRGLYIRPLLFAERHEIEQFAAEFRLPFREDASNKDQVYKRNRIRHTLLPLLQKEFNPQIVRTLNRLASHAAEADAIVEQTAESAYDKCLKSIDNDKIVLEFNEFLAYFNSLQRLILRRVFSKLGSDANLLNYNRFDAVKNFLAKRGGGCLRLADNLFIIRSGDELVISKNPARRRNIRLKIAAGRYLLWDDLFLEIKPAAKPLTLRNKNRAIEFIDADKLQSPLIARSLQQGDYFYPVNGAGKKKVADYFIDAKIPFHQRPAIPILASAGDIVWICGCRLDDRFKVTERTNNIYKLQISKRER